MMSDMNDNTLEPALFAEISALSEQARSAVVSQATLYLRPRFFEKSVDA